MIKRILIISLCISALLAAFVFPASAAELDYNDYITNIQVDGDNDIVTVKFPLDPEISLYSHNPFVLQYQTDTTSLDFEVSAGVSYSLGLYAFRDDFLILDNIPDGSLFTLTYEFNPVVGSVTKPVSIMSRNYFYGSDGSYLGEHRIYSDDFGLTSQTFQFPYNKLSGVSYGKFEFYWDGITFQESGPKSFRFLDFTIVMSISSLYRLQQETGKTNEILAEVEKQLAEQGKTLDEVLGAQKDTNEKLDQIINGNNGFDSSGSDFGSQSDDLAGAGDQMGGAMNDGMASLGTMVNSAAFATTLTTLSSLVNVVFTGHEIEICGIKGNPFIILVTVFSIAVLLPLGLKFVFRKWGTNSSGGA